MNCPSCNRINGPERNYCGACGVALARYCARCGFRNLNLDRFCGGCGSQLDPTTRPFAPSGPVAEPAPVPTNSSSGEDLAELLAAAQEGNPLSCEDPGTRVSQDDIDSLFGD